ncbi:T9SS type A sorting domain-containing protein [Crocinitomicaceae bacterium]|nr:T9SS type A sorting domain-containing protein [Crocinitomicaceae bacterium]MDB4606278.1 T9SS type A sorting domain-containing protein [Crocinitomicaceae bacterium]
MKGRITLFFVCLARLVIFAQCEGINIESISNPGPYDIGVLIEGVDPIRNGPDYNGASIYFPMNAEPPFSGIAIVPGYCGVETDIQEWGSFYASHGIVAITLGTNNPCADWPSARAAALIDAIQTVKDENYRTGSPLFGKVAEDRFAVSGWSMGGGGAQLAASLDPALKAVVCLCPWLDLNGFQPEDIIHDVPVLIFTGQNDDIANSEEYGFMHYQGTPESTDKLFFEITNGDHGVANSPAGANGDAGIYALSWLKTYLVEDPCYCEFLLVEPSSSSAFVNNIECSFTGLKTFGNESFFIYPNPGSNQLKIDLDSLLDLSYEIHGLNGIRVQSGILSDTGIVDIGSLNDGPYLLKIGNFCGRFVKITSY